MQETLEELDTVDIHINSQNDITIERYVNGLKTIKQITLNDLYESLRISRTEDKVSKEIIYKSTGIMPHINVKMIEHKEAEEVHDKIYIMMKTNINTKITYYDTSFKNVSLPNLLFAVKVVNDKITKGWVCCTKDSYITEETMLYRFPLGNVFSDTSICWGNNNICLMKVNDNSNLFKMPSLFLSIPFNDDNYGQANNSKMEFRKLLEYLQDNKHSFDKTWLKPIGTYTEWINKLR